MNDINKKNYNHDREESETSISTLKKRLEQMHRELEEVNQELENERKRHLRTRADFENYRKRVEREAEMKRTQIKKEILSDLITYLDFFDQARKQVQDPAAADGLEIIARQFNELLHKHGVRRVECVGLPFDPEEQEGLGYVESEQYPEGCVAEEVNCGYKLGDILLRPAQVMVACEPDSNK